MVSKPLPPDVLGERLVEVLAVLGPLYRRISRVVEDAEDQEGVSIGVRAVLDRLREGDPEPVPAIARSLELSRQFVQRMVNEAEHAGWVEPVANPAHRRSPLIALTPEGEDRIDAVRAREHAALRTAGDDLTAADVDACLKVLVALRAVVDRT